MDIISIEFNYNQHLLDYKARTVLLILIYKKF